MMCIEEPERSGTEIYIRNVTKHDNQMRIMTETTADPYASGSVKIAGLPSPVTKRLNRKSVEWMPWHWEPMKDVTSCDKLRVGANIL